MSLIQILELPHFSDARGVLTAIESGQDVPFSIKRVYFLHDTPETLSRGHHAHKHLEQLLVCIKGKCKIVLDDGSQREEIDLDDPQNGLLVQSNIWREMHEFSSDCVLLVLASEHYSEDDYIRNYAEFKDWVHA